MRKSILFFSILCSVLFFSQKITAGNPFEFTVQTEKDVNFAWADDSGSYLYSTIHNDMPAYRKFIVRKFDSGNNLQKEFSHDYPLIDDRAMYTYVGSFSNSKKILFFNTTYSSKTKKNEIHKTVFDRDTESFQSSMVASFPIESLMKSGDVSFAVSDNGRYAGVVYYAHAGRKDPKNISIIVFDTNSTEVVWKKDFTLNEDTASRYFAISNSGKAVITRDPSGYKGGSKIITISKDGQDEILLEGDMLIYQPYIFTKGADEYLMAFNSSTRITKDTFEKFLLYDLTNGKIVSNTPIKEYSQLKQPEDVIIRNVFFQNGQFHVFTEAKKSAGTVNKPTPMGTMTFPETVFVYRDAKAMAFDENGVLKNIVSIGNSGNTDNENYRSFGLVNVMGTYKIISGGFATINELNPANFKSEPEFVDLNKVDVTGSRDQNLLLPKTIAYDQKSRTYFFVQIRNNTANLVKVTGYKKPEKK